MRSLLIYEGVEPMFSSRSLTPARAARVAALSYATHSSNWHTATKPAFYAAFYAVDEATWSYFG